MPEPKEAVNGEVSFSPTKRSQSSVSSLGHGNGSANPLGVTVTQRRGRGRAAAGGERRAAGTARRWPPGSGLRPLHRAGVGLTAQDRLVRVAHQQSTLLFTFTLGDVLELKYG